MKYFYFIIACCIFQISTAQPKGYSLDDDIIGKYYKPSEYFETYLKNITSLYKGNKIDLSIVKGSSKFLNGSKTKAKKVARIDFILDGRKLYTSGKVSVNFKVLYPDSDIRYQSNDQLFCSEEYIEKGKIQFDRYKKANLYNEDGSPLYEIKTIPGTNLNQITSYRNKDELNFQYQTEKTNWINDGLGSYVKGNSYAVDLYDKLEEIIAPGSTEIAVLNVNDADKYVGFSHIGALATADHGEFIGHFFPSHINLANGSVFFHKKDGKKYWTLVIDGDIEMSVPANPADEPCITDLLNDTESNVSLAKYIKYPMNNSNGDAFAKRVNFGTYKTKDIENHNGYGINYFTKDSLMVGDHRFLEVGIFLDGKLHGLGYRFQVKHLYEKDEKPTLYNQHAFNKHIREEVFAEAGIFENGKLVDGRVIDVDNANNRNLNFFTKDKVPGFDFTVRKNFFLKKTNIVDSLSYTKIPKDAQIHIERLNGNYQFVGYNENTQSIQLRDANGKIFTVDKRAGNVYYRYFTKQARKYKCNPTRTVKSYKMGEKKITMPVTIRESRKVAGTYGTMIYTTTGRGTVTYTRPEKQFDDYKVVPNPACNPSGYVTKYGNTTMYEKVLF